MSDDRAIYISESAPFLGTKLRGRRVKFENKKLELTDPADIAEMDKLLATKPAMGSLIRKLDIAAAEKIALEHRAQMLAQNAAHKGTASSAIEDAKRKAMEDTMLGKVDINSPEAQKLILGDDNVPLTQGVDLNAVEKEQEAKIEAAKKPKGIPQLNLGKN